MERSLKDRTFRFLALTLALVLATLSLGCGKKKEEAAATDTRVSAVTVLQRDVPVYKEAVGQTRGSKEVEIRARVEGFVQTVDFQEGTFVKEGALLFTIDASQYQAKLAEAKGKLAEAQAQYTKAQQDVARYKPLVEKNAIPRQDLETAEANASAGKAAVDAAQADVRTAQIDLGYTRVTAPVAGLVGKAEVKSGNLVGRGESTLLTTLSDIDPIHVRVNIAERDYLDITRRRIAKEKATGKAEPTRTDLELVLSDGSVYGERGRVAYADRAIDPTTGTLMIEIAYPNPNSLIRPGQFGKVRAVMDMVKGAIIVPQRAVQEIQASYSVAVVAPGDTIQLRSVKPGPKIGSLWAIEEGLKPGERVVVEGLQKVRPGMKVVPTMTSIPDSALGGSAPSAAAPGGTPATSTASATH
jgi:membrane fusion protein (multidrug efflux system)